MKAAAPGPPETLFCTSPSLCWFLCRLRMADDTLNAKAQ